MRKNEAFRNLDVPRYTPEPQKIYTDHSEQSQLRGQQRIGKLVDALLKVGIFYPHGDEDRPVPLGAHYTQKESGYKIACITVIHPGDTEHPSPFMVEARAPSHYMFVLNNDSNTGPRSQVLEMSYGFASVDSGWVRAGESLRITHHNVPHGHGEKADLEMMAVDTDGNRVVFTDSPRTIREIVLFAGFVAPVEHSDGIHHVGGVVILE